MKIDSNPDKWIEYLAQIDAKIVRSPSTSTRYAIRRKQASRSGHHQLLAKKTRDAVIQELIDAYGDVDTINRLIEERRRPLKK